MRFGQSIASRLREVRLDADSIFVPTARKPLAARPRRPRDCRLPAIQRTLREIEFAGASILEIISHAPIEDIAASIEALRQAPT
jgi:hypothetical protein